MPIRHVGATPAQPLVTQPTTTTVGAATATNAISDQVADQVGGATVQAPGLDKTPEQQAVAQFKQLVKTNQLKKYYDAVTGVIDDPVIRDKAWDLFEALPQLGGQASAEEFVRAGLWTQAPRGIDALEKTARYLPGRQVLVRTTVNSDLFDGEKFLTFKEGGRSAITHRAKIAGEDGDNFIIAVDKPNGGEELIKVSKEEVFAANQPHEFTDEVVELDKVVDYASPLFRAKLAEAAVKMDELVGKLDFTKTRTQASGSAAAILNGKDGEAMVDVQIACVKAIHDVIDMLYPTATADSKPGRVYDEDAGRSAVCGIGMCTEQASVMAGLLAPFSKSLGIDQQFVWGSIYRNVTKGQENPFRGGGHGWLQVTFRPSTLTLIFDRTWNQPGSNWGGRMTMDRAYSRGGDRYPASLAEGLPQAQVKATDVNMSGDITIATVERQFGQLGKDGRQDHQSNTQGN